MNLLPINNFALSGLNSDLMPWDLPPEFLTNGLNIRVSDNRVRSNDGWLHVTNMPDDFEPGMILHVGAVLDDYWLVAGKDKVYVYNGSTFTDISEADGYSGISDEKQWTGCLLSTVPVINNPGKAPEYWAPQDLSEELKVLPWDATDTWIDANQSCRIMRSHKQYLFALDLRNGSEDIPDGVRWSSPADISGIPETWDHEDTTNVAGLTTLGGRGGRIIDGLSLKDSFVIYRQSAVCVFDYVQNSPYVWQIRNMATSYGLLNKNCIVETNSSHYYLGIYDILVNDGNKITSIIHKRLKKRLRGTLDPNRFHLSFVVKNDAKSEIWFCIPVIGTDEDHPSPFSAFIYNWLDNSWAVIELPSGGVIHADYGSFSEAALVWDDTLPDVWTSYSVPWSSGGVSPFGETILGIQGQEETRDIFGTIVAMDRRDTSLDGVPRYAYIERVGMTVGGLSKVTTLTRIYPHMDSESKCFIQVGSQDYPDAPVRWKRPVYFDASKDRKVDVKTTGELHCFKVYTDQTGFFSLSGIDVEYEEAGAR